MINIAKLLEDAPEGMILYSPLFGEVKFKYINGSKFGIVVAASDGCCRSFDKYGRYFTLYNNAECLLFPSKDCRTWEGWKLPVELKFKMGDWLYHNTFGVRPVLVKGYNKTQGYKVECIGTTYYLQKDVVENEYHLWTIRDAEDGDVLVTTKIRSCPFIYRKTAYPNDFAYYYAGIDGNGNFCEGCLKRTLAHFGPVASVAPATKEQRDLLFNKIKEAGYEWDEKKKELRKIQPHYNIANFYAGMPVLVRDYNNSQWSYVQFSHLIAERNVGEGGFKFNACGIPYIQCIPFNEETKHLLGTTDMPDECYINW